MSVTEETAQSKTEGEGDLIVKTEGALGVIKLNRPKALNALTLEMTRATIMRPPLPVVLRPAWEAVNFVSAGFLPAKLRSGYGFTWTPAPAAATPVASSVTFTHTYNSANQRTSQATTDNS